MFATKTSPQKKIENYKRTTKILLNLPESFLLPNGWRLCELLIHLWGWDVEYLRLAKMVRDGKLKRQFRFIFYREITEVEREAFEKEPLFDCQIQGISPDEWNHQLLAKMANLSFAAAKQQFISTREELFALYEELVERSKDDDPVVADLLDHWEHDLEHFEVAGIPFES